MVYIIFYIIYDAIISYIISYIMYYIISYIIYNNIFYNNMMKEWSKNNPPIAQSLFLGNKTSAFMTQTNIMNF